MSRPQPSEQTQAARADIIADYIERLLAQLDGQTVPDAQLEQLVSTIQAAKSTLDHIEANTGSE